MRDRSPLELIAFGRRILQAADEVVAGLTEADIVTVTTRDSILDANDDYACPACQTRIKPDMRECPQCRAILVWVIQ